MFGGAWRLKTLQCQPKRDSEQQRVWNNSHPLHHISLV
jgi:hypothetical protein